jgi:hypothetical protein
MLVYDYDTVCSFAWSQGFGYLVINILWTREDSSITVNCFIGGYRSASTYTWHQQLACFFDQHNSGATCSPCPDGSGATHSVFSPLPGPSGKTVSSPMSPPSISSPASVPDSPLLTFPRSPVPQKRIKLSSGSEAKVRLPLMRDMWVCIYIEKIFEILGLQIVRKGIWPCPSYHDTSQRL